MKLFYFCFISFQPYPISYPLNKFNVDEVGWGAIELVV